MTTRLQRYYYDYKPHSAHFMHFRGGSSLSARNDNEALYYLENEILYDLGWEIIDVVYTIDTTGSLRVIWAAPI